MPMDAQVGTDVVLEGLFDRMPVRKLDWEKRSAAELANALNALTQFALLSPGVKFQLYHSPSRYLLILSARS